MRYVSDRIARWAFLAIGLSGIGLAVEGLLRGSLRVVTRHAIERVGPEHPWAYWGFAALYLLGGIAFVVFALRYFRGDRSV